MGNKFYASGEQRAARVQALFNAIAGRYDLVNDLQSFGLHRWWKHRLIRLANVKPGDRALDLCCGTGDLAMALAHLGAQAVGMDFSASMLSVARRRWRGRGSPAFVLADALRVPCPDACFDAVTMGYGLRNLADLEAGLREMARVAKPGGRLLVLDFGKPDHLIWRKIYFAYLRFWVPLFGRVFCGDAEAYAYILESLKVYPGQTEVARRMRELGCLKVRVINLLGGVMSINYGEKAWKAK